MSATITPLPSRSSDSGEGFEGHDRKATAVQGIEAAPVRDSFVAETATKIEQLQATVRVLTRDIGEITGKVAALEDACALEDRWYAFHQSENRSRESKLDETLRCCRDLKARLDKIEARSGGDYHTYNSFEAVSRKLGEIEHSRCEGKRAGRRDAFRSWLLCSTLLVATAMLGSLLLKS